MKTKRWKTKQKTFNVNVKETMDVDNEPGILDEFNPPTINIHTNSCFDDVLQNNIVDFVLFDAAVIPMMPFTPNVMAEHDYARSN